MDEVTKWALAQGGLGVWAVAATVAAVWLFRDRDRVLERLLAKASTDAEVNKAATAKLEQLVQQQAAVLSAISNAMMKRRPPRDEG